MNMKLSPLYNEEITESIESHRTQGRSTTYTEFGDIESMLSSDPCLGEEINQLKL
jgi:hypothetical protein